MKTIKRSFVLFVSVCLLSGCVKLWQKNIDIKTYMIQVEREAEPLEIPLGKKLWIEDVQVQHPYDIRSLITRKNDVEFTTSYYSELLMSPSENFRNGFFNWIDESGMFEFVTVSDRKGGSHRLVATVTDFYGDLSAKQVVLKIKISLLDEKSPETNVLLHQDYQQRVDLSADDAESFIRGYNKAFGLILQAFEEDARKVLK